MDEILKSKLRNNNSDLLEDRKNKESDFRKFLGDTIKEYLKQNNIKIEHLATEIGYDKQHIYGIIGGEKGPSIFCFWRILDCLNISFESILNLNSVQNQDTSIDKKKIILKDRIDYLEDPVVIDYIIDNINFANKISQNNIINKNNN